MDYRSDPSPLAADRSVLVLGINGVVHGMDRFTGAPRWRTDLLYAAPLEALATLLRAAPASLVHGGIVEAPGSGSWLATFVSALETERDGDPRIARTLVLVPFRPRHAAKRRAAEAAARADQLAQKPWKHLVVADVTAGSLLP